MIKGSGITYTGSLCFNKRTCFIRVSTAAFTYAGSFPGKKERTRLLGRLKYNSQDRCAMNLLTGCAIPSEIRK